MTTLPTLVWRPSPNFSSRNGVRPDLVVVHTTEGTYAGAVAWFEQKQSAVSAHFVAKKDGSEVTQMVDLADKAWHVMNYNSRSVGLELEGVEAQGLSADEWRVAARIVAYLLHHLGLPCRYARAGVGPGFCGHVDLGAAGGGHHDPTEDPAVWAAFCVVVQEEFTKADFPQVWQQEHDRLAPCPLTPSTAVSAAPAAPGTPSALPTIEDVQTRLNALGAAPRLTVDGNAGPATCAAIIKALG